MASDSTHHTSQAEHTTVFNTKDLSTTLISINMSNITNLTHLNYIMWTNQIRALLEGYELHQFLDESTPIPPTTVTINGQVSPNPDYAPWRHQDRLLYSALIGAISLPVQSVVSSAKTTSDVWTLLAATYGNSTRGHIRQLKFQIKTCVKGTKTISEYLRIIKAKADELALLGKPLDPEDLTEQILAGLSEDYKPEIDAVNGRDAPISFAELHERLLNREAMLMCTEAPHPSPITANATDTRSRQQWRTNNGPNHNIRNTNHFSPNRNSTRATRPYLGRCQACGTHGHSAKYCPKFRIIPGGSAPWQGQQQQPPSWQSSPSPQVWQPRANPTLLSGPDSSTWLVDTGASHHMTSDLANLSLHSPYNGGDDVLLGDGSGLQISHTGPRSNHGGATPGRQA